MAADREAQEHPRGLAVLPRERERADRPAGDQREPQLGVRAWPGARGREDRDAHGDPNVACLLTWFVPGAGHLYLGRVTAAWIAFVVVQGLYALGWWLSDGRTFEYLDPELRGLFATVLTPEVGNLGAMIAQIKWVGFGGPELSPFPSTIALGSTLCALSGIANVCAIVHAHLDARTPADAPRQLVEFRDLLLALPERQRTVLVMRFLEDCPDEEIAAVLDCRRATVRSLAARALARIRRELT